MATQTPKEAAEELERMEAEEAAERQRQAGGSQSPSPAPQPQPQPQPTNTDAADELREQLAEKEARIADLTAKLNGENGRQGIEIQKLSQHLQTALNRLTAMEAQNKALQDQITKAEQPSPAELRAKRKQDIISRLPPEVRKRKEELGTLDDDVEIMLATEETRQPERREPTASTDDLKTLREQMEADRAAAKQREFRLSVETQAPGFSAANFANPPNAAWLEFYNGNKDGDPDETWRGYSESAKSDEGYATRVARAFNAFLALTGNGGTTGADGAGTPPPSTGPRRPSLASRASPAAGATGSDKAKPKKVFKRSRFVELTKLTQQAPSFGTEKEFKALSDELMEHVEAMGTAAWVDD